MIVRLGLGQATGSKEHMIVRSDLGQPRLGSRATGSKEHMIVRSGLGCRAGSGFLGVFKCLPGLAFA